MRDLGILFIHLLTTVVKLMSRGGSRAVIAESLLAKHPSGTRRTWKRS